jgi:uncharacterized membrane protein
MNIVAEIMLATAQIEMLLGALHAINGRCRAAKILRTWLVALGKALDALIELIGLDRVGAVPWTCYFIRLVVLTIKIDFLCHVLVLLKGFRVDLIAQSLELQTAHVLRLLDHHA